MNDPQVITDADLADSKMAVCELDGKKVYAYIKGDTGLCMYCGKPGPDHEFE